MARDLALDFVRHDLMVAPNKDIEMRQGQATIEQRIRVRLMVIAGAWELDPTQGQLGSHLYDATRLPLWRAEQEIPLLTKEALAPMTDIRVNEVQVQPDPNDSSALTLTIFYVFRDDEEFGASDVQTTEFTLEG